MGSRWIGAGAVAVALIGAGIFTWVTVNGSQAYKLRYKFHPGQADRYKLDLHVDISSPDEKATPMWTASGSMLLKVVRVDPDGSAQIVTDTRKLTVTALGKSRPGNLEGASFTLTPLGQIKNPRLSAEHRSADLIQNLVSSDALAVSAIQFQQKAIRPGEHWNAPISSPMIGASPGVADTRLMKVETIAGTRIALLQRSLDTPVGFSLHQPSSDDNVTLSGRIVVDSSVRFALDAGRVEGTHLSGGGDIVMSAASGKGQNASPVTLHLNMNMTTERIK